MAEITRATKERLEEECRRLEEEDLPEARTNVVRAQGVGDIAENPDVRIALGEVSRIEGRLRVIREKLRYATVVAGGGSVVGTGSIVTVEFSQGECETYLFGSVEDRHDDYDVLSAESPIGLAIGGAAVGESVEVGIGGKVVVVRVVALS